MLKWVDYQPAAQPQPGGPGREVDINNNIYRFNYMCDTTKTLKTRTKVDAQMKFYNTMALWSGTCG
jgi:hypothetical protein